jgi:large repetitive protein
MRRMLLALSLCVVSGCAYNAPTAPTATTSATPNPNEPFSITLGVNAGSGATADHAAITAKVQGPTGVPLTGVMVTFSTTAGDLDPAQAPTGGDGISHTTLIASSGATATAKAGTVSARAAVGTQPPATPPPTPTPTPTPNPSPAPTPPPVSIVLNLPSAGTTAVAVSMFISAPATAGPWTWTFGDGSTAQTSAFSTSHAYAIAGTYTVSVTGSGAAASGKIAISDPAPGPSAPPTPAPAYTVTLTATPSTVVVNTTGVTLAASVNQQFNAPPATSFTWDCGNGVPITNASATQVCPGPYTTIGTATAKVTATGGSVSGSASTGITVTAPPVPAITIDCTQPTPPALTLSCIVSATLNGSPVPSTAITHVDWDWGSNETSTTANNHDTHVYTVTGANTYRIIASNVQMTGTAATGMGSVTFKVQ